MANARDISERLWERVDKPQNPDDCWVWLGSFNTHGYGQMMVGRRLLVVMTYVLMGTKRYTTLLIKDFIAKLVVLKQLANLEQRVGVYNG